MNNAQQPALNLPGRRLPLPAWLSAVAGGFRSTPKQLLILLVRGYQLTVSPAQAFLFGGLGGCRYTPTCSAYAAEALREHGAVAGTILAARRVCRCHPWGGCGHDPVPRKSFRNHQPAVRA